MKRQLKLGIFVFISAILVFVLLQAGYSFFLKKAYPCKFNSIVSKYSKQYEVEPELIYAVIKSESNFSKNAKSTAGAIGLMQIMPDTFNWLQTQKKTQTLDVSMLYDPEINIHFGAYFLSNLLKKYNNETTALAAYNAGTGNVDSWLKNHKYSSDGKTLKNIPYPETHAYVKKVLRSRDMYKKIYYKNRKGDSYVKSRNKKWNGNT